MGNSAGKAGSPKAASVPAADDFAADQAKMLSTIREELRVLEARFVFAFVAVGKKGG